MFERIQKIKKREDIEEQLARIEENKENLERKTTLNRYTEG